MALVLPSPQNSPLLRNSPLLGNPHLRLAGDSAPGEVDSVAKSLVGIFDACAVKAPHKAPHKAPPLLKDTKPLAEGSEKRVLTARLPNGRQVVVGIPKNDQELFEDPLTSGYRGSDTDGFVVNQKKKVLLPGSPTPKSVLISKPMLGENTAFEGKDGFDTQYVVRIPKQGPYSEPYKNGVMVLTLGPILPLLSLYETAKRRGLSPAYGHFDYKELQLINDTHKKPWMHAPYIRRKVTDLPNQIHPKERTLAYCDPRLMHHQMRYHVDDLRGLATILSRTLYRALTEAIFEGDPEYMFAKTQDQYEALSGLFNYYYRGKNKQFFENLKAHGFLTAMDPMQNPEGRHFAYAKIFHLRNGKQYLDRIVNDIVRNYPKGDQKTVIISLAQSVQFLCNRIRELEITMDKLSLIPKQGPLTAEQKSLLNKHIHLLKEEQRGLSEQNQLALIAEQLLINNPENQSRFFKYSRDFTLNTLKQMSIGLRRNHHLDSGPFASPSKRPGRAAAVSSPRVNGGKAPKTHHGK